MRLPRAPSVSVFLPLLAFFGMAASVAGQSSAVSRGEALAAVFPGAELEMERIFLSDQQAERIEALSREDVRGRLYVRFIATLRGQVVGRSYADTHIVRTKRETLLVSLEPDGRVRRIDVTAFMEPPEYQASERWLQQYDGRPAGDEINLGRAIRPILGATLTGRAANSAVRRIQAMDAVLEGRAPASGR